MRDIGIGLVGYGFIGRVHTAVYRSLPVYYPNRAYSPHLVGVCSRRESSVARALADGGYQFGTRDYDELLASDAVDVVDICTPNHLHKEMIIKALAAGKSVYVDKPLVLNMDEAREVEQALEESPGKLQVAFQYRYIPAVQRARQLVAEGALGEIFHFRAAYLHSGYAVPTRPISWRAQRKYSGGGALFDLGSHIVDMMGYLLGDYERVWAQTVTFVPERPAEEGSTQMLPVDVDDYATLKVEMSGGGYGFLEASRFATGSNNDISFEVYGSKGALRFSLMDANWLYFYDTSLPGEPLGGRRGFTRLETVGRYGAGNDFPGSKHEIGWMRYHYASQHAFLTALCRGDDPSPGIVDALRVQAVLEAAQLSTAKGGWIDLADV